MSSQQRTAAPSGRGAPRGLVAAVLVVLGGLVAAQVLVGGVPLLEAVVPRSGPELELVDAAPPRLDCGSRDAEGGLVAGAVAQRDLAAAAHAERDASAVRDTLVAATGYRRGGTSVDVVWVDGSGRARLVLKYAGSGAGWVLTGRSACPL